MQATNRALGAELAGYAGITSFMRQPVTRDLTGADLAANRAFQFLGLLALKKRAQGKR